MRKELSASEAIFGFCGWLTTRKEKTVMSSGDDASIVANLIKEFCVANNFDDPIVGWEKQLEHPKED